MLSLDRINAYALSVCQQIRWKKAHLRISEEISNHIADGRDAYMAQGLDEQTATDKAITDIGDAPAIGTELDRIHRPKPQWVMFAWVAGFLLLGLSFSFFLFDDANVLDKIVYTAVSVVIMVGAYFADFTILGKHPVLVCLGVVLLMAVMFTFRNMPLIMGMGHFSHVFALILPVVFAPIICISKNKRYLGLMQCLLIYWLFCIVNDPCAALIQFGLDKIIFFFNHA
jgi:hypothetical protein